MPYSNAIQKSNRQCIFFREHRSVLLLLFVAIVSSTLYAIYVKEHQGDNVQLVLEGILKSDTSLEAKSYQILEVFVNYFKRYMIVWLLGVSGILLPVGIGVTFLNLFAYGFSMTTFYVFYGLEGIQTVFLNFGLQGVLFCTLLLKLSEYFLQAKQKNTMKLKNEFIVLIYGIAGCLIITIMEFTTNSVNY